MAEITRSEMRARLSELSCPYRHLRMTDCPHCAKEVSALLESAAPDEPESVARTGETDVSKRQVVRHTHVWGTPMYAPTTRRWYRFCVEGWCPMGITGKVRGTMYVARPERRQAPR